MAKPKRDPHWSDEVGQLDQDVETLKAMGRSLRDVVRGGISQMRAERRDARGRRAREHGRRHSVLRLPGPPACGEAGCAWGGAAVTALAGINYGKANMMTEQQTVPPIVFVDTETTGVGPDRVPWEIAVVRRDPDGTESEHQWFLPVAAAHADGFALRLGGFWDRHPGGRAATGPATGESLVITEGVLSTRTMADPARTAVELMRLTHGAVWVGVNPRFDAELVERLLREHGLQPTWDYHLVDPCTLALGYLHAQAEAGAAPRPPRKYRSNDLAERLGIEPTPEAERHTALGDARWCVRLYDRVMGRTAAVAG